ncbi:uncharacterized protein LOC107472491 [Arachis duranensis]|uniref:Uncharacterized protein LOC107472491 n=1 Tax=Arachis duranensis TaxID=130453 RepID=A0A6P4BWP3_ARADU|nr:uncharacterized protein LOC107472491 [Arachis duranensis]
MDDSKNGLCIIVHTATFESTFDLKRWLKHTRREIPTFHETDERILQRLRREAREKNVAGEEESDEEYHELEEHSTNPTNPPVRMANNNGQPQRRVLASYTFANPRHCGSSILTPNVDANNFELKPQLITLVQNNCSYGGGPLEDPNQHLSTFLRICNIVKTNGVPPDSYKLMLFPFSLRDKATQWLESFPRDSINNWDDLVTKFLAKFYPPQRIIRLKAEVQTFTQMEAEPIYEAWERYKALVRKCPPAMFNEWEKLQNFYEGLTLKSQEALDHSAGASLKSLERQIGQLSKQISVERPSSSLPSDTIPNPKEECKAIQLRSGRTLVSNNDTTKKQTGSIKEPTEDEEQTKADKANEQVVVPNKSTEKLKEKNNQPHSSREMTQGQQQIGKSITPPLPYPQRCNKEVKDQHFHKFLETFKKLEINIPLAEALEQMPLYAKFLKELINKKRSWEEKENVLLTEECRALIQKGLPPKLEDPGSFLLPCTIGNLTITKAMCDLGASINLIPSSMVKKLHIDEVKLVQMSLELVDKSMVYPRGVIENILVKVDSFIYPADFVVLDSNEDDGDSVILGRPFLATARAIIDIEEGELTLRMQRNKTKRDWKNIKIPTEGLSKGDKVQLIYQQLGANQQTEDYYTVSNILSLEHAEIEHQRTKKRITVRGDKLRLYKYQPP